MSNLFIDGSKLLYHLDRVQAWKNGENVFPLHVEISPSSACNHRCVLCCVDYKGHKAGFLSRDVLLKLADDLAEAGVRSYLLAGEGEPLLNKHVVEFVQRAHANGVDGSLTSNGVLLTPEVSEGILPHLVWARFSMQTNDPERYAQIHRTDIKDYHTVTENLKYAGKLKREKGLEVTLGTQQIMLNENWQDVYSLCKYTKDLGFDYYTVKRFSKHPLNTYDVPEETYLKAVDQFEKCKELEDENFKALVRTNQFEGQCVRSYDYCVGLPFITQILADGNIAPCCMFYDSPEKNYGNLNDASFLEIWRSDRKKQIMNWIEENIDVQKCMTYCRHHSTNLFLWQFKEPPAHINFI